MNKKINKGLYKMNYLNNQKEIYLNKQVYDKNGNIYTKQTAFRIQTGSALFYQVQNSIHIPNNSNITVQNLYFTVFQKKDIQRKCPIKIIIPNMQVTVLYSTAKALKICDIANNGLVFWLPKNLTKVNNASSDLLSQWYLYLQDHSKPLSLLCSVYPYIPADIVLEINKFYRPKAVNLL
jgi:hypothetical protein